MNLLQDEWSAQSRLRPRVLEAIGEEAEAVEEVRSFNPLPHGRSGDNSLASIPFQVSTYLLLHFPISL